MESAILAKEALQLTPFEKAQIIDALWQSLDPAEQKSIDRAWLAESQNRLRAFRAGELKALDGNEALQSIETELKSPRIKAERR
jgi:putative addiction module component (TIGR02574 family)